MRIPEPLPSGFSTDPFTVSEADASGVSRGRLRHARIIRLSRSIRWVDSRDLADLQSMPPHRRYRAYTQVTPYSVASHDSAAEVWEFPMPSFADDGKLHITRLTGMSPQRRGGVSGHTGQMFAGEICVVDGLSLTSRERTWLDLAQRLTVADLTVITDYLIRIPRPEYENRTTPYATKESLQAVIDRHSGKRGIRKARLALELSRIGADSPPETLLRLALADAGLPEPLVNRPILDAFGNPHHRPDLSYPDYRVAVEYEGAGHSEPGQVERDISREERTRTLGWTEVRISRRHMADDGGAAVSKVRSALIAAGWRLDSPYRRDGRKCVSQS
ncbi:endonuclease domain-containing protein [Arthrobacter sp. Z1-15]